MFKLISVALTALFLVFGAAIGVFNPQLVTIDLLVLKQELALSILLSVVFILGMLVGASIMLVQITQLKWRLGKQKRANQKQSDQILQLKKASVQTLSNLDKNRQALLDK
ncbi:MAG: LapA family protein [Pseudomonadota bacterium]|nr:LapA family protein [Pseudomonadota bacterium]